jgi:dsDNA-specific endonuclease/ATPase MutS2
MSASDDTFEPDEGGAACDEIVELPIDGTLDLHSFHPREVAELVADYVDECRSRGILEVRIVHGKGTGTLRRIVHSALERQPAVSSFRLAGHGRGSWGATLAELRPAGEGSAREE